MSVYLGRGTPESSQGQARYQSRPLEPVARGGSDTPTSPLFTYQSVERTNNSLFMALFTGLLATTTVAGKRTPLAGTDVVAREVTPGHTVVGSIGERAVLRPGHFSVPRVRSPEGIDLDPNLDPLTEIPAFLVYPNVYRSWWSQYRQSPVPTSVRATLVGYANDDIGNLALGSLLDVVYMPISVGGIYPMGSFDICSLILPQDSTSISNRQYFTLMTTKGQNFAGIGVPQPGMTFVVNLELMWAEPPTNVIISEPAAGNISARSVRVGGTSLVGITVPHNQPMIMGGITLDDALGLVTTKLSTVVRSVAAGPTTAQVNALIEAAEADDVESVVESGGIITVTKHDGSTNIITLPQGGGGLTQDEVNALIAIAQRTDIQSAVFDDTTGVMTFTLGNGTTDTITIPPGTDDQTATEVSVDTAGFSGNLSGVDGNVQALLAAIDGLDLSGGGGGGGGGVNDWALPTNGTLVATGITWLANWDGASVYNSDYSVNIVIDLSGSQLDSFTKASAGDIVTVSTGVAYVSYFDRSDFSSKWLVIALSSANEALIAQAPAGIVPYITTAPAAELILTGPFTTQPYADAAGVSITSDIVLPVNNTFVATGYTLVGGRTTLTTSNTPNAITLTIQPGNVQSGAATVAGSDIPSTPDYTSVASAAYFDQNTFQQITVAYAKTSADELLLGLAPSGFSGNNVAPTSAVTFTAPITTVVRTNL